MGEVVEEETFRGEYQEFKRIKNNIDYNSMYIHFNLPDNFNKLLDTSPDFFDNI